MYTNKSNLYIAYLFFVWFLFPFFSIFLVLFFISQVQLHSRPLKSILLSDIQQYNYQTSIVNLQVFVSLGIETCRFL